MALTRPAPARGTWTYDDLLALPEEGKRYEIIEGVLYERPAPNWAHATVLFNLTILLAPFVQALGGYLRFAPFDVFFPGADPVQPDIVVLLPGSGGRPVRRGAEGPPALVVEVLSPSNRGHDLLTKRALYARAGVREYWIVDPLRGLVTVHRRSRGQWDTRELRAGERYTTHVLPGFELVPESVINV